MTVGLTKTMANPTKFTDARKCRYLAGLVKTGTVGGACKHAKITRETVRLHRDSDEAFAAAELQAREDHVDLIEAEIKRRAMDGIVKPFFYQGERVDDGKIREFSDVLLLAYAKRHIAAYRDRATIDHNVTGGVLVIGGGENDAENWPSSAAISEAGKKP